MKILIICPHYDFFIKSQTEELAKYYDEINVIIPKWKFVFKNIGFNFSSEQKNVKIHYVELSPFLFFSWKKIKNFIKLKNIKFDLVISHFIVPYGFLGNKIAKYFGKKSVVIGHGFDVYSFPFKNIFYKKITQNILKNADKIITVSNSNLICLNKLGFEKKTVVIPNGFDSNKFFKQDKDKSRKKLKISSNKKIILTVGNLVEVKNQKNLIKACFELKKKRNDFICYIVGDGVLKDSLKKQIDELNLNEYVKLLGKKPHDEIPLWMSSADIFVLPSYSESFGVVNVEALACGLPVISTKNGGSEEIITSDNYGYMYENPEDFRKLSQLLDKGLNNNWNYQKILKYSQKFTWKNACEKIIKECEEVLK
jgi:glycosyltransferase involved in cell wall biosynthesis